MLAAIWWAWAAYAWLTIEVDGERRRLRLAIFGAMIAMLLASLAIPGAFEQDALLFALAYLGVRLMHIILFAAGTEHVDVRAAAAALALAAVLAPALLIVASGFDGDAQTLIWIAALAVDYVGAAFRGIAGWRLSPGHFAERHGLIVIIALGESIVALGAGATSDLNAGVIVAALLGFTVAGCLWWAYFDVVAIAAERRLTQTQGNAQLAMARDSYSYLHLPMVAGIILFAVGVKKTMGHVGDPLETVPAVALCGGVALYLFAHVLFRLRNMHSLSRRRLVVSVVLVAIIPAAVELPALATLALVAALCAGLIAYESIRYAEARDRLRHAPEPAT